MLLYFPGGVLSVQNDHADVGNQLLFFVSLSRVIFFPKMLRRLSVMGF